MYLRVREIVKPYEPCHTKTEVSYNGAIKPFLRRELSWNLTLEIFH